MIGEFLLRLAVALPIICALAAAALWLVKRGRMKLPTWAAIDGSKPAEALQLLSIKAVTPSARVAIVGFDGRKLLLGVTAQRVELLAVEEKPGRQGHDQAMVDAVKGNVCTG